MIKDHFILIFVLTIFFGCQQENGKSKKEHLGRTVHEVLPHLSDQIISIYESVIDTLVPVGSFEIRGQTAARPDEKRIFVGEVSPLFSKSGKVLYLHTLVMDNTAQIRAEEILKKSRKELEVEVKLRTEELSNINVHLESEIEERKRAEETARAGEERLRRLLESTQIIPWEADARTWRFTYVGPQAALFGYPEDRWYEQDFWVNHLHPEDREEAVNFCVTQSRQGENFEFDYRMIAFDGREIERTRPLV